MLVDNLTAPFAHLLNVYPALENHTDELGSFHKIGQTPEQSEINKRCEYQNKQWGSTFFISKYIFQGFIE